MAVKCFTSNSCSHKEGETVRAVIEIFYSEETLGFASGAIEDLGKHLDMVIQGDGYLEFYELKKARTTANVYPLNWCEKHLDIELENWAYGRKVAGLADEINWFSEIEIDSTGLADTCKLVFGKVKNLPVKALLQIAATPTPFKLYSSEFKPQQSSIKTYEWIDDVVHPMWVGKLDWTWQVAARTHLTTTRYNDFLEYMFESTGEQLHGVSKSWVIKAFDLVTPEVELYQTGEYADELMNVPFDFASNVDVYAKYLVQQTEAGHTGAISDAFYSLADLVR